MVMRWLRDKIKIVLFATLLAFVGLIYFDWGWNFGQGGGTPQRGTIGKVNGKEIPYEDYRRTHKSIVDSFEAERGRAPEQADYDAIEEQAWMALVQNTLLQQQIEKYGITATDPEIMEVLRTSPPAILKSQPDFLNERGEFDNTRYQQALANPSFNWLPVENFIRVSMPTEKINTYVGLNARVTSREVRERFLDMNEKVRVRYVSSSPSQIVLEEGAIPEADLQAYYDAHPDSFRVGQQAVLEFVRISKTPSAQDSSEAREDLEMIRARVVQGGQSFEETAESWSDDERTAAQGGDLGFIRLGGFLPKELEDVAFNLDKGEISEVFLSSWGFHFVKVEDKRGEGDAAEVRVRHVLGKIEASNQTLREADARVDSLLADMEEGKTLPAAAETHGLQVEVTPPFERDRVIPGLGLLRAAHRFAFANEPGKVTTEPIEDTQAAYLMRLVELRPPSVLSFEDARERVRAIAGEEKRRQMAKEKLEAAIAASDGSLASIASHLGAPVDTTGAFSRESFVPRVGRKNAFVAKAFQMQPGEVSGLVESDRGCYALELVERIPADETQLESQKEDIKRQLLGEKRQTLLTSWFEQLYLKAEIIDYRSGNAVPWTPPESDFSYRGVAGA
jgi:parvulin-like peptidyl-prolyl isomerase